MTRFKIIFYPYSQATADLLVSVLALCCALLQIIRILEKLSSKQAYLFNSVSSNISNSAQIDSVKTAETADNSTSEIVTTAFPFLLKSKITAQNAAI